MSLSLLAMQLAHVTPAEVPWALLAFVAGVTLGASAVLAYATRRR